MESHRCRMRILRNFVLYYQINYATLRTANLYLRHNIYYDAIIYIAGIVFYYTSAHCRVYIGTSVAACASTGVPVPPHNASYFLPDVRMDL